MVDADTPCAERSRCPVCKDIVEAHDAPTHTTRTLCDGSTVTLAERWILRIDALRELGEQPEATLRNYELESRLSVRLGGAWVVAGPCPFNGMHTASGGR